GQGDDGVGGEPPEDHPGQGAGECGGGPEPAGEDAVIARRVPGSEASGGAQEGGDGPSAGGQDGAGHGGGEPLGWRAGECGGEPLDQGLSDGRYNGHEGLLAGSGWGGVLSPFYQQGALVR